MHYIQHSVKTQWVFIETHNFFHSMLNVVYNVHGSKTYSSKQFIWLLTVGRLFEARWYPGRIYRKNCIHWRIWFLNEKDKGKEEEDGDGERENNFKRVKQSYTCCRQRHYVHFKNTSSFHASNLSFQIEHCTHLYAPYQIKYVQIQWIQFVTRQWKFSIGVFCCSDLAYIFFPPHYNNNFSV